MASVYLCAAVLMVLVMTTYHVRAQNPQAECLQSAQALMKNCADSGSISHPNFLWFVTNGTSSNGQAPADEAAFKAQICDAEPQVGGCIITQLVEMANNTPCSQAIQVVQNVRTLLITYDNKCADPCRFTLVDDLRDCYASSGLDPELFLSNRSAGHVIGATDDQVTTFCSKKDALLGCMKPIHNSCPESLPILSTLDFHLPSYEKGIGILCSHPKVYLKGLECFAEPTPQVEGCVQKSQQAFIQATVEAQSKNWTQQQFVQATCKVTIEQADCDLKAWAKKNHEACNKATIGLRREMECNLMPPNCTTMQKGIFDKACHPDSFNKGHRNNFGKPGGSGGNGASTVLSLPGALLLLMALLFPVITKVYV